MQLEVHHEHVTCALIQSDRCQKVKYAIIILHILIHTLSMLSFVLWTHGATFAKVPLPCDKQSRPKQLELRKTAQE